MAKYYLDDIELYSLTSINKSNNLISDTQMTAVGTYRRDNLGITPNKEFTITTTRLSREKIDELIIYIENTFDIEHNLKLPDKTETIEVYIINYSEGNSNDTYFNNNGTWEDTAGTLSITFKQKGTVV